MHLPSWITTRLNTKAISMLLALILAVAGIGMIFMGIKDEGFIDIKSTIVEGHVKAGLVGVVLIFLSVLLALVEILAKPPHHVVKIKNDGTEIEWDGEAYSYKEALTAIESLAKTIHNRVEISHNNAIPADAKKRRG